MKAGQQKWDNGIRAHERVKNQLRNTGRFELLVERWRAPLPIEEGLGELDLVFRSRDNQGIVIEVKSFSLTENGQGVPCLTHHQLKRIWRSLRYLRLHYAFGSLRFFLALVDLQTGRVEFLENPC